MSLTGRYETNLEGENDDLDHIASVAVRTVLVIIFVVVRAMSLPSYDICHV